MDLNIRRSDVNPAQWKLLQNSDPVVLVAGGYGSGKSAGIALKTLQLKAMNPGVPGLMISQDWRSMWAITLRRMRAILKYTGAPQPKLVDKQGECYLDFGDGVPIYLRSARNPESLDGLDVGWATGDEARHWKRESYTITLGRVRVPCPLPQVALASTPDELASDRV